jgi:hypothetical protein
MGRILAFLLGLAGLGSAALAASPEEAYRAAHDRVDTEFDGGDYESFAPSPALKAFWDSVDAVLAAEGAAGLSALAETGPLVDVMTMKVTDDATLVAVNWDQFGHLALLDHGALRWSSGNLCLLARPCAVTHFAALPPAADGAARFYVEAAYAQAAGATRGNQLSLWRWKDGEMEAFSRTDFATGGDAPQGVALAGDKLEITGKGFWSHFMVCGACDGRQEQHLLRVTPTGVVDLGMITLTPELDALDALLGRLADNSPTDDIAAPEAAALLKKSWHGNLFFMDPEVADNTTCIAPADLPPLTFHFAAGPKAMRITAIEPGHCG